MKTGVLLMAHGTPASLDEMPEYLTLVRGGRAPSAELVAEMRHNYESIGGSSPLTAITNAQAAALGERLGADLPVVVGMRNWRPFIADALRELTAQRVERVIAVPLAPQFSELSVQKYIDAARAAAGGVRLDCVRSFHAHPLLLDAFAERVRAAGRRDDELLVFTAHSLPVRVIAAGDPYSDEVAQTAQGVADRSGYQIYERAYQSAGRTPEPWIGPDINELLNERAALGVRQFLIAPIGFVCDHTEILFDIDVQAAATARALGVSLRRTESLNTSPTFISALEDIVRSML
jgi:ferrochelatase